MSLYSFADDKKYINYTNWVNYRTWFHHNNPRQRGRFRADIELVDDPIRKYPELWYACDEWTFIDNVHEVTHPNGNPSIRGIMESNHHYGERLIIYSTFCSIWAEPWGRGIPQVFAYYKDRLWRVSHLEWMMDQEWKGNIIYPLTNRCDKNSMRELPQPPSDRNYTSDDYLPATFPDESEDETASFIRFLMESDDQYLNWLVLADWLEERDHELHKFIRSNINKIKGKPIPPKRVFNLRTLTAMTVQFLTQLPIYNNPIRGNPGICAANPIMYVDNWHLLSATPTVIQPAE